MPPNTSKSRAEVSPSGPPTLTPPWPAPRSAHPIRGRPPPLGLPQDPHLLARPFPRSGRRQGAAPPPCHSSRTPPVPEASGTLAQCGARRPLGSQSQSVPTRRGPSDEDQRGPQKQQQRRRPPARAPAPSSTHGAAPRPLSTVRPAGCAFGSPAAAPPARAAAVSAHDGQREKPHAAAAVRRCPRRAAPPRLPRRRCRAQRRPHPARRARPAARSSDAGLAQSACRRDRQTPGSGRGD